MFATVDTFFVLLLFPIVYGGHPNNLAWNGGPIHRECEHSAFLTYTGQCVKENVVIVKAVTYKEKVYVISPRWKRGVLATVWLVMRGRHGVELDAYPEEHAHNVGDCRAIQNAVDFHLDHLGNLWVLDTGVIETLDNPKCTCTPKVFVINIARRKITKNYVLTSVVPNSLLQNIVVENGLTKAFIYISDASRGVIIVHDISANAQWSVLACAPAIGLQLALIKHGLGHSTLFINRLQNQGLFELDTNALQKNSPSTIRVYGDQSKPVVLLGADVHHIYFRHLECRDVLAWDTREPFNSSYLQNIHSPGPRLTPTSVSADPQKHFLIVLDSNYGDTMHSKSATYHRITFIDEW